ncbi:DUF1932 domain-containing protein [Streptomyces kronopolitis]|uniref:NAD(P)-dependent oxidoreductase n=1 Tax=Streptomyces kronopolitis TaxID=1612435 RepID=UPI00369C4568
MGAAVAAQAKQGGAEVLWCPEGRSTETRKRAIAAGFSEVSDIAEMARRCDVIMAICPPANAESVAGLVSAEGFRGIYVDANAVSPATMASIKAFAFRDADLLVDGSVVGSPPSTSKTTRLYLSGSGEAVAVVAGLFSGTAVDARILNGGIGKASALKLSYSSYQKASRVLAAVAHGLARDWGVQDELIDIAGGRSTSYLAEPTYIPKVAARAWRWAPEMREAAAAVGELGFPDELAEATAAVMERWAEAKDQSLGISEALELLRTDGPQTAPGPSAE